MTRYTITSHAAREAVGTTSCTWTRWTGGLPSEGFERLGQGNGSAPKRYDFADLVPCLRERRRGGLIGIPLARLMDCAPDIVPGVRLPDGADEQAAKLIACLSHEEVTRFDVVRTLMHKAAVYSLWNQTHLIDLKAHLDRSLLIPTVADRVLTGRQRPGHPITRDQWGDLIAAFVIANATPEEIKALSANKEFSYV